MDLGHVDVGQQVNVVLARPVEVDAGQHGPRRRLTRTRVNVAPAISTWLGTSTWARGRLTWRQVQPGSGQVIMRGHVNMVASHLNPAEASP
mgnify:CR=1 FL=1